MNRIKRAKTADRFMTIIFYCIAVFFFMLLAAFAGYVIIKGFAGADASMFKFSRRGSIGNQLFNTIYLVFLSLLITVPIGTFAGIYLAKYAKGGIITKFIRICIETLSSLPSIVVGLFGYLIFLVIMGMDKSLMAGALSVSILTLPLITTTTEDAVKGLPKGYFEAGMGLGSTRWQAIFHVLLPACLPRIMTGIILAAGRGFGEAAVLLYTTGSGTNIRWSNWDIVRLIRFVLLRHFRCRYGIYRSTDRIRHLQILHLQFFLFWCLHSVSVQMYLATELIRKIQVKRPEKNSLQNIPQKQ